MILKMGAALVLVLVLEASGEGDASLGGISEGTRDALGEDTRVTIEQRSALPADSAVVEEGVAAHASVVVEVAWSSQAHERAHLRVHAARAQSWVERELVFGQADEPGERNRSIGLAIGAMVAAATFDGEPAPAPAAQEGPVLLASPLAATAPADGDGPFRETSAGPTSPEHFSVAVRGTASAAVGADARSFGAALAATWAPSASMHLRAVAVARTGELGALDARLTTFGFGAGVGWYPVVWHGFALGPRLDLLAMHDDVHRAVSAGAEQSRWVPAVAIAVDAEWRFGQTLGIVVGVGSEVALGTARLFLGDREVAVLPPLHPTGELGLRARF